MISVISPTYNGSVTLPLMLEALCQLELPTTGCEFIFVDNASTDDSANIIAAYQDRLPILLISEPRQGKNYAVQAGVTAANGDLVLFTDDDVIPSPDWLSRYQDGADKYLECSVFAGQVRHYWMKKPASWLRQLADDGMAFAGTPTELSEGSISAGSVKGPNFLVRKALLDNFKFDTDIGPNGSDEYTAGSETEFLLRVEGAGHKVIYLPQACVQHIVRPAQMPLRKILKRYYRIGRGMASTGVKPISPTARALFGYPRYIYWKLVVGFCEAFACYVSGERYEAVRKLMALSILWGRADIWRRVR